MSQPQKYYQRFTISQRIEHWVQVLAFTTLAVTGIPQKFVGYGWAESMIAAMGGIEMVRVIHRYAAIILLVGVIYHGGYLTYKMFVERVPLSMMMRWQDIKDLFAVLAYNLGMRDTRPPLPRYNFEEKIEYWAFVWGTVIMVITGFMLWNPIASAKFLPGSFIPAAKAAHGGEALLAVLAIIIWHMYGVHIRKLNRSMFSGKLSREEMEHEHALELEEIEHGSSRIPSTPEGIARRTRVFIPVATVITLVLLFGLYWFVTLEETAINTVAAAPVEEKEPYQPLSQFENSNFHDTITQYDGPESCIESGCHGGDVLSSASNSDHSHRINVAGPDPVLAKMVPLDAENGDAPPNCLVCHAQNYQPDDLLASVHTVRVAGGETCERCHTGHPEDSVHNEAGLACVSCHKSENHQIQPAAGCESCHPAMPHEDPFINSKHARLDCRSCHINTPLSYTADTAQAALNPATGLYVPALESTADQARFMWQTKDGAPATVEDEAAVIVPVNPVTILAPADINLVEYAATGQVSGAAQKTGAQIIPSHGVQKDTARTCDTCHGPEGDFDFAGLGYDEETAEQLSAKPAEPEE